LINFEKTYTHRCTDMRADTTTHKRERKREKEREREHGRPDVPFSFLPCRSVWAWRGLASHLCKIKITLFVVRLFCLWLFCVSVVVFTIQHTHTDREKEREREREREREAHTTMHHSC